MAKEDLSRAKEKAAAATASAAASMAKAADHADVDASTTEAGLNPRNAKPPSPAINHGVAAAKSEEARERHGRAAESYDEAKKKDEAEREREAAKESSSNAKRAHAEAAGEYKVAGDGVASEAHAKLGKRSDSDHLKSQAKDGEKKVTSRSPADKAAGHAEAANAHEGLAGNEHAAAKSERAAAKSERAAAKEERAKGHDKRAKEHDKKAKGHDKKAKEHDKRAREHARKAGRHREAASVQQRKGQPEMAKSVRKKARKHEKEHLKAKGGKDGRQPPIGDPVTGDVSRNRPIRPRRGAIGEGKDKEDVEREYKKALMKHKKELHRLIAFYNHLVQVWCSTSGRLWNWLDFEGASDAAFRSAAYKERIALLYRELVWVEEELSKLG